MGWKAVSSIVVGALAAVALVVYVTAPKDYDDCVLRYIKAGMAPNAAHLLSQACYKKFPPPSETKVVKWEDLSDAPPKKN